MDLSVIKEYFLLETEDCLLKVFFTPHTHMHLWEDICAEQMAVRHVLETDVRFQFKGLKLLQIPSES
jgi:hypothetical protein